ncbi:hypothetical protein SANTM175S_08582 [Streptomyces antimycoticus]
MLRTEGLSLEGEFDPLDLVVRPGEVLGLAGATASGNTAVGETLVGLRKPAGGQLSVRGRPVRPGSVPHAIDAGIGYVPEDRHDQGLVLGRSVAENATLTVTDQLGPYGTVLPSRTRAFAQRMITSLDIKTSGPSQPVSGLSGGNQQKVVIARALAREPSLLVAIRPTAGVDVKSKDALLGVVRDVAAAGSGAVIVSDELDDLRVCDRVLAFFHGRVVAEFDSGWSDRQLVAAMEGMTVPGTNGTAGDTGDRTEEQEIMTDTAREQTAEAVADGPAGRGRPRIDIARWRDLSLVPVIFVLGVIGFIVSPAFLTEDNLIGVVQQSTELGLLVLRKRLDPDQRRDGPLPGVDHRRGAGDRPIARACPITGRGSRAWGCCRCGPPYRCAWRSGR